MAGVTLGFLKYVLGLDTLAFRKGMTDAERDLVKLQKSFEAKGKQFQNLGKSLTAFVTLPIAGIAAAGIREAQETATAMAQVNSALASTGGAAKVTADQLKTASDALELKSLFEGDQILKDVSARLLAFGNITGATFGRAQQLIVDFATRTGRDLGSATTLIGKALNDPAKAMGVLSKAGVQLTTDQKELIKSLTDTGNVAGAQAVLLGALETKFKGAAEAAQNADPINKFNDAWKQMAETVGTALLPVLPVVANAVASVATAFTSLPASVQTGIIIFGGVAAAVGPVLLGFGSLLKVVATIGPAVTALGTAWTVLKAGLLAARVAALATIPALTPFLIPLAAIAAAVGVAYVAWKNWDKIKAIVASVYAAVKTYLLDKFSAVVAGVKAKVDAVIGFFHTMWDKLVGHSYVPDTVDAIQAHFSRLDGVMVDPARKATAATTAAFSKLREDVSNLLDQIFPEIAEARAKAEELALLQKGIAAGTHDQGTLIAAQSRILGTDSVSVAGAQPLDQLPGGLDIDQIGGAIDTSLGKLPQLIDLTHEWGTAMGQIGAGALRSITEGLGAAAVGEAKLGDVAADTFKRMTAALVQLAAQMLILKAVGAIFGQGSSAFGFVSAAFGVGGARASGGPVLGNVPYLVGERGPEIFVPSGSGKIVSNDNLRRMGGSGMPDVHVHVTPYPGMTTAAARQTGRQAGIEARDVIARSIGSSPR
jgi:hypothetical protein